MSRTTTDRSNLDRATYAVFGASLGLIALTSRNSVFRVIAAATGLALVLRATASHEASRLAAVRSQGVDDTLADTFPASDPPASHLPDVPPSNAEAKWEAHRNAMGDLEDVEGSK